MQKGTSVEDIADMLEEDFSVIQSICNIAEKYAPEYEVEKICRDIEQNNMWIYIHVLTYEKNYDKLNAGRKATAFMSK